MKRIVMLGTAFDTMGGISSVVNVYRASGLFDRWPIHYLPTHCDGSARRKLCIAAIAWLRFIGLLLTGQVGLVHVHCSSRASFWRKSCFLLPAFLVGRPVVLHMHASEFMKFYGEECGRFAKGFISWVLNRCSVILALSHEWKRNLSSICTNPDIRVLFNPVGLPPTESISSERVPGRLLFLGRLGIRKGIYDLLDALARLLPAFPHAHLVCGGDGEVEKVRERAAELGIGERVELVGWVRGDDKTRLLLSSAAYVLPSYHEGLPMGVLEAMAHGLPVVSTYVGGIPDAVSHGVEGALVHAGDVNALEAALRSLLSDESKRQDLARSARAKIEAVFAADRLLPELERVYRLILGNTGRA